MEQQMSTKKGCIDQLKDSPPMKPVIKEKWLTALRSGECEQGWYQMRAGIGVPSIRTSKSTTYKYCVLGMLVKAMGEEFRTTFRLPLQLQDEAELSNEALKALGILNDTYHLTFNQLADLIEEYV